MSRRIHTPSWLTTVLLPAAAIAGLVAKLLIIGHEIAPGPYPQTRAPFLATLVVLSIPGLPLLLLRGWTRVWCALAINFAGTAVAMADLWHVRFYGDVWSVVELGAVLQLPVVASSVRALLRPADALAILDLVLLAAVALSVVSDQPAPRRSSRRVLVAGVWVVAAIAVGVGLLVVRGDPDEVFEYEFQRQDVIGAVGLAGYHAYDLGVYLVYPVRGRLTAQSKDMTAIEEAVDSSHRDQLASRLSGIARGRNVILLNAESLADFTIGLVVDGQPITPNLTAFARESLHYTDFYDQTYRGTTSDAEFITLNSLMGLPTGSVATRFTSNNFRALPKVLSELGYQTLSACGEPPSFWNMRQMHAQLGFSHSIFLPDLQPAEWVGLGLDDAIFFDQLQATLRTQREPFLGFLLSSSSHHPYQLPDRLQRLRPKPLAGTMAGDYLQSIRYFDEAFGRFVHGLTESGLLDRSVIVVYGDHQSWVDETDLQRLWLSAGHTAAATPYESWRFRRRVPLMIRLPGGVEAGVRETPGGHLDITPTILSLLGVSEPAGPWLGRDLTAPHRSLVVFRDGSVTDGQSASIATDAHTTLCYGHDGLTIPCGLLALQQQQARQLLETSDRIIAGDLAMRVTAGLRVPPVPPRMPGPILVIAHRGDSLHYPENTLTSLTSAFDLGADVVEADIRLTRDGVPMVFHDDDLDRTTSGHGPFERLTLREVKALDAGSWMSPKFAGLRVPTLEEALRATRGRGRLYLDLKVDGLARPVAEVYSRAGVEPSEALVAGWTPAQRAEFARDMPRAHVLTLDSAPIVWGSDLFRIIRAQGLWGFELGDDLPPSFVSDAAMHGVPLFAYTVNDEPTMRRLIEMGVAGIESDDPALLLKVAASLKAR